MKMHRIYVLFAALLFASIPSLSFAQEKTETITQLTVTGTDIANVFGIDVYKFRVPLRSKNFAVTFTEQASADSEVKTTHKFDFTLDVDAPEFDLILSFTPTDGTMRNALLSDDKTVDFSAFCKAGDFSTMNRIEIPRPLSGQPTDTKSVMPMTLKMHEVHSSDRSLCLLEIAGRTPSATDRANEKFPVARVFVTFR